MKFYTSRTVEKLARQIQQLEADLLRCQISRDQVLRENTALREINRLQAIENDTLTELCWRATCDVDEVDVMIKKGTRH